MSAFNDKRSRNETLAAKFGGNGTVLLAPRDWPVMFQRSIVSPPVADASRSRPGLNATLNALPPPVMNLPTLFPVVASYACEPPHAVVRNVRLSMNTAPDHAGQS